MVSVLALASSASAEERVIQPGTSFSVEVELSFMEVFTYSWTSDEPLDFVVEDPVGTEYVTLSDVESYSGMLPSYTAGTYTLTWTNPGSALAHLDFDLSGAYGEVEEGLSMLMWAAVIGGIVVTAIIVIVVIVVVMGGKKAPQQQAMGPPPQMAQQAMATGHCPTCGNTIDPNTSFCSKCGTRFR